MKALEQLSKSLQDGKKLAGAEDRGEKSNEHKEWMPAAATDYTNNRSDPDCEIWDAKLRPKSLNFEIFLGTKDRENKTDDEKLKDDIVLRKGKAQSLDSVPDH